MKPELVKALENIRENIRAAQGIDGVEDTLYSKLDEILYLVEDILED